MLSEKELRTFFVSAFEQLAASCAKGNSLAKTPLPPNFQISRIPVREGLSHLAAEGLANLVANRGAVVSALSPEEIMELFENRAVLECYMRRCAIPRMKPEDFQRAEDVLRRYQESLEKGFRGGVLGTMELAFPFRSVRACESRKDAGSRQESERQLRPLLPPTPGRYPRPTSCRPGAS